MRCRCGADLRRLHATPALLAYSRRDQRLVELGFETYEEYLASPRWAERRDAYLKVLLAAQRGVGCVACDGTSRLAVHHLTYARVGAELDEDLTVLCRDCHTSFHKWARWNNTTSGPEQLPAFIEWRRPYVQQNKAAQEERRQLRNQPLEPTLWARRTGGFLLADNVTNTWIEPGDGRLAARGVFYFVTSRFLGATYPPPRLEIGSDVTLVREPTNRVDRCAVQIWHPTANVQIGWVPRTLTRDLAPRLNRRTNYASLVTAAPQGSEPTILLAPRLPPVVGTIEES